jgi:hypothetical protein
MGGIKNVVKLLGFGKIFYIMINGNVMGKKYKHIELDEDISDDMLMIAFGNSYKIVTGETTYTQIVRDTEGDVVLLAHDPTTRKATLTELEDIIIFYEMVEHYEKCAVLKKIMDKRKKKKRINFFNLPKNFYICIIVNIKKLFKWKTR